MFELWFALGVFLASLFVLILSSSIVLDSSIKLGKYFGIGEFAVGFILISVITSLPELAVSISAALVNEGSLIVGTVVGSNISNILLILGLGTLFGSVYIRQKKLIDSAEILLLITIIPLLLLGRGSIAFWGGLVLLVIFLIYTYFIAKQEISMELKDHVSTIKKLIAIFFFIVGVAVLMYSATVVVDSASQMALLLGVPIAVIGLTVVAVGTSLPELVITINALKRGHGALALGDILGSCVVNLTLILGVGALITKLTIDPILFQHSTLFLILATVLLSYFLLKHKRILPIAGLIFILLYIIFLFSQMGIITIL